MWPARTKGGKHALTQYLDRNTFALMWPAPRPGGTGNQPHSGLLGDMPRQASMWPAPDQSGNSALLVCISRR